MNKYSSINYFSDTGNRGSLSELHANVVTYLNAGEDEEIKEWLEPIYLFLEWTSIGNQQAPFPALDALPIPVGMVVNPVPGHNQAYTVPSVVDGEFLLGRITIQFPNARGTVVSSPLPLIFR